jgi:DNA invertase Pin-like site-specific DNA recombinase
MDLASASVTARAPSRAAQYVRMSTEHQQYSPENQLEIIRQYAAAHNMEIVQDYSDHGRSGLNIAGREGLNQLMADVEAKRTNFTSLLVYDVSRWGRFQPMVQFSGLSQSIPAKLSCLAQLLFCVFETLTLEKSPRYRLPHGSELSQPI